MQQSQDVEAASVGAEGLPDDDLQMSAATLRPQHPHGRHCEVVVPTIAEVRAAWHARHQSYEMTDSDSSAMSICDLDSDYEAGRDEVSTVDFLEESNVRQRSLTHNLPLAAQLPLHTVTAESGNVINTIAEVTKSGKPCRNSSLRQEDNRAAADSGVAAISIMNTQSNEQIQRPVMQSSIREPSESNLVSQCLSGISSYNVVGLPETEAQYTFDRAFLSKLYGGSPQTMFPKVSCRKIKDGINNLAFINPQFNPFAPKQAGAPGLFFVMNPAWSGEMSKRLFVRLKQSKWLNLGQYKFRPIRSLTAAEFKTLSFLVQTTWAHNVRSKGWGKPFIARIYLRAYSNTEPSEDDILAICSSKAAFQRCKDWTTEEKIIAAFHSGRLSLNVSCLSCVGYEINWQKYLILQYPAYIKDKEVKNAEKSRKAQAKIIQKHKHLLKAAGLDSNDESDLSDMEEGSDSEVEEAEVEAFLYSSNN